MFRTGCRGLRPRAFSDSGPTAGYHGIIRKGMFGRKRMAEETGRSSDNLTQQSQEKSRWRKFKSWLLDFLRPCMVWLVGGTLGLSLFLSCLLEAMAVAWSIVKAVRAGKGFPSYDIICYDIICISCLAIFGVLGAHLCGCRGHNIVRLIQSSSGRVAVCLKKPVCWAPVMIVASCGSACSMLFLSSLTAPSLSSLRAFLSSFSWPWIGWVLLLGLFVFMLAVVLRLLWRPAKEWMEKLPLFVAIAIWAVLGIIAFLLAMWWLGRVPFWQLKLDPRKQAENIVKIALTLVGGVGAVAYLVIKYQERQQAGRAEKREKDRLVGTKVQDAINQLGSDKASTRIAGVYALTDIADTYRGGYRQRVVDILCGYLRSDRSSYAPDRSSQPVWDASYHLVESVASDKAVESTILSVMRKHLRKKQKDDDGKIRVRQTVDDDQLWCACTFDLHEATFHEAVDLTYSTFECGPNFRGTKFERNADFGGATFTRDADFHEATFAGRATFGLATTFTGGAYFGKVHFTGDAYFGWTHFAGDADFHEAHFTGDADFGVATFTRDADFHEATFAGRATFGLATIFTGKAYFGKAHFTGDAYFGKAHFTGGAYFAEAHFTGGAYFRGAEFRDSATFSGIQDPPSFRFEECKFNERSRGTYEWGPIPIPEDNDGLPAGAVWKDFLEEDDDDGYCY